MSADLARALALAEKYGIALDLVDGDRLHWRSRGPTPDAALEALKAAKGELINLLVRYRLNWPAVWPATMCSPRFRSEASPCAVMALMLRSMTRSAARSIASHRRHFFTPSPTGRLNIASRFGRSERQIASKEMPTALMRNRLRSDGRNRREVICRHAARELLATRAVLASGPTSTTARSISPTRPAGGAICSDSSRRRSSSRVLNAGLDDDSALLDPREASR